MNLGHDDMFLNKMQTNIFQKYLDTYFVYGFIYFIIPLKSYIFSIFIYHF